MKTKVELSEINNLAMTELNSINTYCFLILKSVSVENLDNFIKYSDLYCSLAVVDRKDYEGIISVVAEYFKKMYSELFIAVTMEHFEHADKIRLCLMHEVDTSLFYLGLSHLKTEIKQTEMIFRNFYLGI